MLSAATRREFDVLIMYDLDRLSRLGRHQTAILELLDHLKIKVIILDPVQNHVNDGTFEGEVITSLHGIVSEREHIKRIRRSHDGVVERTEYNGSLMPSSKPLYGYRWDDPTRKKKEKYIIYEPEAQVVRRIFNWKHKGVSIHQICLWLNAEGIPHRRGLKEKRGRNSKTLLTCEKVEG